MNAAVTTFSIGARDPATGDLGVAVASRYLAVGSLVPHARAAAGLVITQSSAYWPHAERGLKLLAAGSDPGTIIEKLLVGDAEKTIRQFAVLDRQGRGAAYSGRDCVSWAGHRQNDNCLCLGNMLAGPEVLVDMEGAFLGDSGVFWDRLLAALKAGEAAGGDKRGQQAAALLVVRSGGGYGGYSDRLIDLRVDDHPQPVKELQRLLKLWGNPCP